MTFNSHQLLADSLTAAAQLHIFRLQQQGGPSHQDYAILPKAQEALMRADELLLHRGKGVQSQDSSNAFNAIAKAIALLAFAPGGVTLFNTHFEAQAPLNPS